LAATADPIELDFDADLRRDIGAALHARISGAVQSCINRDGLLADFDDQLKCRCLPVGPLHYRDACVLNDPMTLENHTALKAMMAQACRRDPWVYVEAQYEGGEDNARLQENWLTWKNAEYRLYNVKENLIHNTLRDPVGILFVNWQQKIRNVRRTGYRVLDGDGQILPEGVERDPGLDFEEVTVSRPEVVSEGCEFRVVDLANFYLCGDNPISIEEAKGVCERMWVSEETLIDGIEDYGYDLDAVEEVLQSGPSGYRGSNDWARRRDEYFGVNNQNADYGDGDYELFLYIGKLPYLRRDGFRTLDDFRIPEEYLGEDVMVVMCGSHVLKMALWEEDERPYIAFYILPEPNSFYGNCIPSMLEQLQEEATAAVRWRIDSANFQSAPVLIVPEEDYWGLDRFSVFPGNIIAEKVPNSIRPLVMGGNNSLMESVHSGLVIRAQGVCAAEGYGQMNPQTKQRHNDEIQNMMQGATSKFDLFNSNFQSSIELLAERIIVLTSRHLGHGQTQTFMSGGRQFTLTADNLRGQYRYAPTATSQTANPETRMQILQFAKNIMDDYLASLNAVPPQYWPLKWHAARELLMATDMIRQPESWIGPEPPANLPPIQAWEQSPEVQAMVAQGVPPQVIAQQIPPPIQRMGNGAPGGVAQAGGAVQSQMAQGPQAA